MRVRSINKYALSAVVFVLMFCALPSRARAQGWYNSSWSFRVPVNISNPNGTALANFQVHIALSSTFDFASAASDGSDVRLTASDGVTAIPFWIESWNAGSSTASLWVQVPSIPASGTTVYLYYDNPGAASASSGDSTFLFFDDFTGANQGPQTYFQLSTPTTIMTQTQSWEDTAPHTLSVLQFNQGGHTYWGWYGLQDSCPGAAGLAWSQDLVNWTKDTSNPLFTNARWPSVVQVGSTLYMAYEYNYCYDSQINLASSTDGIHWTMVKTLVPADYNGESRNQNPNLWMNPNDGQFYLYWYNGNDSNVYNIMVRKASSPVSLDSPSLETTVLSSTGTLAAPNMLFYNGTYFLATEQYDSNRDWIVDVYSSTSSPTGGFTLLAGTPVLANSTACMFQYIFGTTLHVYLCNQGTANSDTGDWIMQHSSADLTVPPPAMPNSSKWNLSAGSWQIVSATKPDGSTGFVLQGKTNSSPQVLPSTFSGTNYILEAYGQQLQGVVWGLGFRTQSASKFYSLNLYDNHNGTNNLYSYRWNSGSATQLGDAQVGTVSANTWYKLSARVNGSGFDLYKDNALQFHTSDSTYGSGGVALYGETGTTANFSNVLVRSYAITDPTTTVGEEQSPGTTVTISSVSVNPTSVTGGTSAAGTVNISAAAPSGGAAVTLSSNNAAATVPSSINIPAGSTTANFTVSTSGVSTQTSVTITASSSNSATAKLTVNPPTASSISLDPSTVTGGTNSTGTVTLTGPAPTGGIAVTLSSATTAVATVPSSVTVAANATTATFQVTTLAVSAQSTSVITATLGAAQTATITVNPPVLASLTASTPMSGGTSSNGTVTLNGPAPTGGIAVTLSSSNTSALTVPASVTVPASSTTATFQVTALNVTSQSTSTITATLGNAQTFTVTVNPAATVSAASVSLNSTAVTGGTNSTGTVTLSGPAPAGGATVTLSSGNTSVATVPASVTVAANATTATFQVTTLAVSAQSTSVITATLGSAQTATITVNPPVLASLTASTPMSGGTSSNGTVTLNGPAPTGGIAVTLSSSNTSALTVPASVTIPASSTTATFQVTALNVTSQSTSTITATLGNAQTFTVTVNPAATVSAASVSLNSTAVTGGTNSTGTVTLSGPAPAGGATVTLSSGNTSVATVPASVTVAANATTATFQVTTLAVSAQSTSVITATLGSAQMATVTVNPPAALAVSLNPSSVQGGNNSSGTVTLTGPAPTGGIAVALSSSNTAVATVPASVTVPANATSAAFTVASKAVAATSTATITAALNGNASATLTVTPVTSAFTPIRIAAGSSTSYTDSQGQIWSADTGFSSGNTWNCVCTVTGTPDPLLYENQRWGVFNYSFNAPAGNYVVTLKWAEEDSGPGQREFNVAINGTQVLSNFDIYAASGGTNIAFDKSFNVTSSGTITISFTQGAVDFPKIDAIQITQPDGVNVVVNPTSASLAASQQQQFTASVTGSTNTAVTWSFNPAVGTLDQTGLYTAPSSITTQQTVTVTATSAADTTKSASATVTLNPPAALASLSVSPSTVVGGANSTGTVKLSSPAPAGGATVTLSSNNPAATVPANAVVSAGATSATFTISTSTVSSSTAVSISGTYNGTQSATLTVNPASAFNPIRIAAGSSTSYTDSQGQVWSADTGFSSGNTWNCVCTVTGTADPLLYENQRWGVFTYTFSVPAGSHVVTLKWAEEDTGPGQREFNVAINGATVLSNFDIYAASGGTNIAFDKSFNVTSTGTVTISFTQGAVDFPKIDAIEIQ